MGVQGNAARGVRSVPGGPGVQARQFADCELLLLVYEKEHDLESQAIDRALSEGQPICQPLATWQRPKEVRPFKRQPTCLPRASGDVAKAKGGEAFQAPADYSASGDAAKAERGEAF